MTKKGAATGGVWKSPKRKARDARRRRAQESNWAAKSGPVTVRRIGEDVEDADPAADAD